MKTIKTILTAAVIAGTLNGFAADKGNKDTKNSSESKEVSVEHSALVIDGIISSEEWKLQNATVNLYENNDLVETTTTNNRGKFELHLLKDKHYTVEITKSGYLQKRIVFSTEVPGTITSTELFKFEAELFKEEKFHHVNEGELDFPVAIVEFDKSANRFTYNSEYTNNRMIEYMVLKYEAHLRSQAENSDSEKRKTAIY